MPDFRRLFGTRVETLVADYLRSHGYRILEHQWKTRFGEIDLICQDGDEVVFVEVKARRSGTYGFPEESVGYGKIQKIVRCAEHYLNVQSNHQVWRIDVVAVEMADQLHLTHLKNIDMPDRV